MNVRRAQSTPFLPSLALAAVAWLALFGALALPATTQAQTEITLVSNIEQGNTGSRTIREGRRGLTFTTGPNTSRYILSNVEVVSVDAEGTPFDIWLCTVVSDAQPTSNCTKLDRPDSLTAGTLSFDVPPAVTNFHGDGHPTFIWHTLAPNKTYALLFHTYSTVDLGITTNDGEDEGHEEGWTIGNAYLYESFGTGWVADTSGRSFRIAIKGGPATAGLDTYPLESTDAALSALVVKDGTSDLTLTPTFASGTTSYAVSVGYAVDEVTVKPSKSDDNATVEYLDASDNALADADATERGQQAALAVGENTIKVKVTAEDRPTTQTYTVTVTRASETTPTNLTAEAVAPMRVTLEWDRTLPSPKIIDRDDGYKIEWSADGSTSWTSLVNYTNQHGTFDIWCTCYPMRFNDDTITPGTTRYYRVKAVDDDEESAWSDVVSATTPALVDSDGGRIEFGAVVSELDALNDQKVFRIGLESEEYRFMVRGKAPKHRVTVTDQGGTEIENFVLEAGNGLSPRITAQSPGEHQVKISHGGGFGNAGGGGLNAGWFQFQLVPVSDPAVGTLRLPDTPGLNAVLSTYGDVDGAEVAVQPGKAYAVRVRGRETGHGTAATPRIKRARPPSNYEHNMGKPWVDGVTTTAASTLCHNFAEPEKCEFQAFVIDLRGQTGAEQTWQIIVAPTARPRTWPYPVGTYLVDLRELSSSQLAGVRMPLRAWFASQPEQHDGSKRIKVRVAFSESPENVGADGVSVDGGEVTSVRPVDGQAKGGSAERKGARSAGGQDERPEDREVVWELEIDPDSDEDVTISLEAWRPCNEPGAICTADGRTLSTAISTTVRGPDEVAAPEPPDKPTGLSATATQDSVTLTWDDPQDESITGYVILRRVRVNNQGGDFSVLVADTASAATTYTDNTVAASTTYTYRIKATNEHGVSERSRWFHIDTPAAPEAEEEQAAEPPDKPKGLSATATHDQVVLTWDDPGDDSITGYVILRRNRDDDPKGHFDELVENTGTAATTHTDDTVEANTNYTYRIKAINGAGTSERSRWFHIDTPASPAPEPANSPATGAPTISGTTQVGGTLTVDTSGIADADGLSDVQYEHQWLADDAEIAGAIGSTYTLADVDEGKAIKVEVSFTDDAGNSEALTSGATDAVAAASTPNSPATGAPAISGTAQVGETLAADMSGISDADGLGSVRYEYQWLADDAEIAGATGSTYTLADTDEGKAIKVQVGFTDDQGNEETLTSGATAAVVARPNSPATGAPTISGTAQVGETLTADTSGVLDADGLTNPAFTYQWLANDAEIAGATGLTYTLADIEESKRVKVQVSFTDDEGNSETLTSAATDAVDARPNSPATGAPTIAGTAQVGETLTADTSGIADADGLGNVQYEYLWLANDSDISGATSATYTLAAADEGKAIKVRVSFTDDAGNEETLTSAATDAVAAEPQTNTPATGAPTISGTAQVGETLTANTSGIADADGLGSVQYEYQWLADDADIAGATGLTYTLADSEESKAITVQVSFTDDADNEETLSSEATGAVDARPNSPATGAPTISGTAQVGETLTANTSGIADADGLGNVQYEHQWLADDADIAGATGLTYTLADADEGKAIKVRVSFTDDAGNGETLTSAATDAVAAAPTPNSPATGAPTISGIAQVGETLTADTSGIADANGLSNVQYEYQWLADDADISGATNATYTLADADEGKAISLRVSFTDDAGNEETLTSAATEVVAGAQPAEPPDKPRNLSATATHDSVTLTWDNPGDDSITGYVILRRIPGVDPEGQFDELAANTGTAATTYTDDTVASETRYTYRIKAINGAGTSERSRWVHIDTPAAPVPDKPTGLEATASHDQVVLTWDDPGDNSITGYVILRRVRVNDTGGDFDVLAADTASAATTYTDDTVAASTTYTYRIKAINEHGISERSRWVHIDTPAAP